MTKNRDYRRKVYTKRQLKILATVDNNWEVLDSFNTVNGEAFLFRDVGRSIYFEGNAGNFRLVLEEVYKGQKPIL